ncbi:MAG: hypothetical protein MJE63_31750 [Proteobacteria bacterium]|nr:hypothetical protein [Pseudomonadota bacterium]
MKNLLILFFLAFPTLLFAEDIVGFNFGGVFEEHSKYQEFVGKKLLPHEYIINDVKFFDSAQVGTDKNKTIKSIAFQKKYTISVGNVRYEKTKILEDYQKILGVIEKRYGEFDKSGAQNLLGQIGKMNSFFMGIVKEESKNITPKSDKIGTILLLLDSTNDITMTPEASKNSDSNAYLY